MLQCLVASVVVLVLSSAVNAGDDYNNHWAVIVCSSRYWFNYRHLANALSVYWMLRRHGIPDERIILMNSLANAGHNRRNSFRGTIVGHSELIENSTDSIQSKFDYTDMLRGVQFDYLGADVNARSLAALLTGRQTKLFPSNMILNTNQNSSILIYLSGHGGDEFLKFHDSEEISANDFRQIFNEMYAKSRYGSILFVVETCQASTLGRYIDVPNVLFLPSSQLGENSYSYNIHEELGVSIIDRFTYSFVKFFQSKGFTKTKQSSMKQLLKSLDKRFLYSTASLDMTPNSDFATVSDVPLSMFFYGSRATAALLPSPSLPQSCTSGEDNDTVQNDPGCNRQCVGGQQDLEGIRERYHQMKQSLRTR